MGQNGRVEVDHYLRVLDQPDIYVAGDLAAAINPATGRPLPPTAQLALAEADTVAHNLLAELEDDALEPFSFEHKGLIVSVGGRSGVGDLLGRTVTGRPAHILKDVIAWEYRQSVKHLRGWSPL